MTTARMTDIVRRWGLIGVLLVLFAGFSLTLPDTFPTSGNMRDILTSQPPLIFIALGAMIVLKVGEFDLSLGATLAFSQYLVILLMKDTSMGWGLAVVVCIAVGAMVGLANAALVVGVGISSFIATIGVSTILGGLLTWISNGNVPIFGGAPHAFLRLANDEIFGIPLPVWYALVAAIAIWILLEYTVFGRELGAVGANLDAARLSGLRPVRARVAAFVLAGVLAAVGGVLLTARVGAADASTGLQELLAAYAAAFLGMSAVRPGFFNVWGTLIAIFVVAVGITGIQLHGADAWVTPVFNGGVLLIAVSVSTVAARRQMAAGGRAKRRLMMKDAGGPAPTQTAHSVDA